MQIIFTMVYYDIADKGYLVHDGTRIASHFMVSSYYLRAENRRNRFSALLYYLPVSRFIPKSFSTEISTPFSLSFSL